MIVFSIDWGHRYEGGSVFSMSVVLVPLDIGSSPNVQSTFHAWDAREAAVKEPNKSH